LGGLAGAFSWAWHGEAPPSPPSPALVVVISCRWKNHLDSRISRQPWTAEEDRLVESLRAKYGNQWKRIALEIPGRFVCSPCPRGHLACFWGGRVQPCAGTRMTGGGGGPSHLPLPILPLPLACVCGMECGHRWGLGVPVCLCVCRAQEGKAGPAPFWGFAQKCWCLSPPPAARAPSLRTHPRLIASNHVVV
jgi:hypothetical protein